MSTPFMIIIIYNLINPAMYASRTYLAVTPNTIV